MSIDGKDIEQLYEEVFGEHITQRQREEAETRYCEKRPFEQVSMYQPCRVSYDNKSNRKG